MTKINPKVKAKALAATSPAAFARALDLDPKRVRHTLRKKLNVHVSKGDDFSTEVKTQLLAHYAK